jgi:membrane fusion protein
VSTVERQIADITAQVENNKAAIARLDMMIANAASERAAALESHANLLASLREQKSGLEAAVETQAATVAAVERNVKSGYARRDQLASEFKFLVDFRRQLGEVAARITEAASTSAARVAEIDQRRNGFANSRSELINQNHGLSSKLEEVRTYESIEITAPTDGTLVTLPVRAGSTIRAGQFVAAIADPNAPLRIVLEVPSKAVGLLRLGNRVNLKYDAFPFKTFGIQFGIVTRLSQAPLIAAAEAQSSSASSSQKIGEASFLVEVEPARTTIRAYGEERAVPVGSTLQADIVVERRRLLDWILDPVYAMKGRG